MKKVYVTFIFRLTIILLLFVRESEIPAQIISIDHNNVYGLNPSLYNGKYYTFFSPTNSIGNQYFKDRQFGSGTVTLRGVTYSDLLLNYDICNQQLILKYEDAPGITQVIIISDAWLENFSVNEKYFRIFQVSDNEKHIYQEIGTGQTRVLYSWRKYMRIENNIGGAVMTFSKPSREMNLLIEQKIVRYKNNRSFIKLFGSADKENIREYLHKHRINVKKAGDSIMEGLIDYCNTLSNK